MTLGSIVMPLDGSRLSGAELAHAIAARTEALAARGLGPGGFVFLHHGNRPEFFIDLLAAWRLGACAIPLDPNLAGPELENLAATVNPRLSIWADDVPEHASVLSDAGVTIVDATPPEAEPARRQASGPGLDQPALILFTSGTTGQPKGVVHTHRTLRAKWLALRASLGSERFARTLCMLPTHFGHGLICNALYPWLSGNDLYLTPPFRADTLVRLGRIIDEFDITCMSSVPALWRLALKLSKPPEKKSLQRVLCGSAPLSDHLWREVADWTGTDDVINAYGITETGSWLAGASLNDAGAISGLVGHGWGSTLRIGAPGAGADDFTLGGARATEGEVWVSTAALMTGYFQRQDLTDKVVRAGWFNTGDEGFLDEQGRLVLKGRTVEEINRGGMKVYPADIECVIEAHPDVADVCVFACEDPILGQEIAIAVVSQEGSRLDGIKEWLASRLSPHKHPRHWYLLDQIPRTDRGKVNRARVAEHCAGLEGRVL